MSDTLRKICDDKQQHIAACKARTPLAKLQKRAADAPAVRGFHRALQSKIAAGGIGLIAEIKKASPSKGLIRADFNPAMLAQSYAAGGASCLSVLTDRPYFQGEDAYLIAARDAVTLPVLRKDFMLDPYQVVEARALGADCILLIMAALSDAQARELEDAALSLEMDVLVEVHTEEELTRALQLKSRLLGVNNRDLKTLKVDLAMTEQLADHIPAAIRCEYTLVSESGIKTPADIARMRKTGAHCFLVGESLMLEADVKSATRHLLGA
jgi:indole-3-glycerol phosphate synthase